LTAPEANGVSRSATVKIAIAMIAVAAAFIIWNGASGRTASSAGGEKAFFTDDDGKTWFKDDVKKLPPFERNGKQAVRCFVYRCGESGRPWVSHLMRYTAQGKKQVESKTNDPGGLSERAVVLIEVKEAGTGNKGWIDANDPRAAAIQQLTCPDGTRGSIIAVDAND